MLDGAARLGDLLGEAAKQGMPAIAITDHGNTYGAFDFWKQSQSHGVKAIIGTEAYLTPGTHRGDKTRIRWGDGGGDDVTHQRARRPSSAPTTTPTSTRPAPVRVPLRNASGAPPADGADTAAPGREKLRCASGAPVADPGRWGGPPSRSLPSVASWPGR